MKAVVMAGGEGSRLRPLTLGRPKPMVPVVDRPCTEHILELLKRHGITEVVMTVQYMANAIQDYFGDGSSFGMSIQYSVEETPLGTAGSVKNAEQFLQEPFLVISGDALTDFDLKAIADYHFAKGSLATLTLTRVPNPLEYGVIITGPDGHIRQFLEKPSWGEVFSDTVNTGIYILDPKIFDYFPAGQPYDFSQQLFPMMLERGDPIYGYIADGYWCDIGSIADYARASGEYLDGKTNLSRAGKHIGGGIWCNGDVEIARTARLQGPIYLGDGVRINDGATIIGPAVVRDSSIIDERARIERSIIWRNCYIGEGAEIQGAIICKQCQIRSRAIIFEGVVIGDQTTVGEGALIQPNVKLWPSKQIEEGATVSTSIIWSAGVRRSLFSRYGISGLVNIDLTPEDAARLGAAYGAILKKKSTVVVNRENHQTPRMIKRALISGLPSAGVDVADVGSVPIPVARYIIRDSGAAGGLHVRLSPRNERVVDIRFFDSNGMDIDRSTQRKIETTFFREDIRRVYLDEIGTIDYAPNVIERYTRGFMQSIDMELLAQNCPKNRLVIDYANAGSSQVLPDVLSMIGCDVVAINSALDSRKLVTSEAEFYIALERLAAISGTLTACFGARLGVGGDKVFFADGGGKLVTGMEALAAFALLSIRANGGGAVAVPVTAPNIFEKIAEDHGGEIIRTKASSEAIMHASTRTGVILAGDGEGNYIFPSFMPAADGMFAIVKLLELTAKLNTSLRDTLDLLPKFAMEHGRIPCRWEDKGRVMRLLSERYRDRRTRQIDGVKINLDGEWVLVLPDPDRPLVHIYAESRSQAEAKALVDKYSHIVTALAR